MHYAYYTDYTIAYQLPKKCHVASDGRPSIQQPDIKAGSAQYSATVNTPTASGWLSLDGRCALPASCQHGILHVSQVAGLF
jgi:hypothetical protein